MHKIQFKRKILLGFFFYLSIYYFRGKNNCCAGDRMFAKIAMAFKSIRMQKIISWAHTPNKSKCWPKKSSLKKISWFDAFWKHLIGRKVILTVSLGQLTFKKGLKNPINSTFLKGPDQTFIILVIVQEKYGIPTKHLCFFIQSK